VLVKYRLSRSDVDAAFKVRNGRNGRTSPLAGRNLKPKY
jgi:hypothetical protein